MIILLITIRNHGNFKSIHLIQNFTLLLLLLKKNIRVKEHFGKIYIEDQDKNIMIKLELSMKQLIFLIENKLKKTEIKFRLRQALEGSHLKMLQKNGSKKCKFNQAMFILEERRIEFFISIYILFK